MGAGGRVGGGRVKIANDQSRRQPVGSPRYVYADAGNQDVDPEGYPRIVRRCLTNTNLGIRNMAGRTRRNVASKYARNARLT